MDAKYICVESTSKRRLCGSSWSLCDHELNCTALHWVELTYIILHSFQLNRVELDAITVNWNELHWIQSSRIESFRTELNRTGLNCIELSGSDWNRIQRFAIASNMRKSDKEGSHDFSLLRKGPVPPSFERCFCGGGDRPSAIEEAHGQGQACHRWSWRHRRVQGVGDWPWCFRQHGLSYGQGRRCCFLEATTDPNSQSRVGWRFNVYGSCVSDGARVVIWFLGMVVLCPGWYCGFK